MKKIIVTISVVLVVVLFSACKQNEPKEVVKKYYTHFCKGEYEKASHYVAEEHRPPYGLMDQLIPAEERKMLAKREVEVSNINCKLFENDTEAICSCVIKIDNKEPQSEEIKLKKVDGTWLVDQGKENAMTSGEENPAVDGETELSE